MESRIAKANAKYYKNKNILIGIAIFLTSLLLFLVPTIGRGIMEAQYAAVNETYPTWHAVFRNVDEKTKDKIINHHNVENYGLRCNLGCVNIAEAQVSMMHLSDRAADLYRLKLTAGKMPKKEDEIVVSKGMMKKIGKNAKLGDRVELSYQVKDGKGFGFENSRLFVISGFIEDDKKALEKNIYSCLVSENFMRKEVAAKDIEYQIVFQVVTGRKVDTTQIEDQIKQIGKQFGIKEERIGINKEYLMANYVDPAAQTIILGIMVIIVLAGAITIYSIYYVNMPERIREFGQLRSIGATRKQVKRIVFGEGMRVALWVLPIGLLVGTVLSKVILISLFKIYAKENILMETMSILVSQGKVSILSPTLYVLTIVVTLFTVCISLLKPMQTASKISEISAMRYEQGALKSKKKTRKSYKDISILRLSKIHLLGNKKNSFITIISMSITGVFIMVIATVLSCANPRESANDSITGQYSMGIDVETGNKEHPEKEWHQIIKNNPLTAELRMEIEQVEGVKSVTCFNSIRTTAKNFGEDRQGIMGVPKEYEKELLDGIIEGHVTIEELENENKVIIDKAMKHWYPEIEVGDKIRFKIEDGVPNHTVDLEVAAIGDYSVGFNDYNFILTTFHKIETLCKHNTNERFSIFADKDYDGETYKKLENLMQKKKLLEMRTWKDEYEGWKSGMTLTSAGCYTFLGIIALICVMNMVNTMINSVHVRKKEIAIMQAIGMTEQQLVRMLQQEGLFYTIGTLVSSIGIGSLAGYPIFLWAKVNAIFNINTYHYPWQAALIVTVALVLIQISLTAALGKSVKKDSIIDRIRFSE